MILTDTVSIKITKKNIKWFRSLGYDISLKEIIVIPTNNLTNGSHIFIKVKCDICGKEKEIMYQKYFKNIKKCNLYACSSECAQFKVKKYSLEKFGEEYYTKTKEYKERVKLSNTEKYGCEYHIMSDVVKNKMKETNLKRYGVKNPFSNEKVKNKIKETNLKRYGVENPSHSVDIKLKISKILRENNRDVIFERWKDYGIIDISGDTYTFKCDKGHVYSLNRSLFSNRKFADITICTICNPSQPYNISDKEKKLVEYIKESYKDEIILNNRTLIKPYEIDIYIPKLKIGIEFNGLYWHNEENKPNDYHKIKSDMCEKIGISLLHIWEDDWNFKKDIVKSIILNKLNININNIHIGDCVVREVSDINSKKFLDDNNLQCKIYYKTHNIGLYYNEELVSIMVFGLISEHKYELFSFCNKLNTNIIDGDSKILKYFINNYKPIEISTSFDKSFGYNNLYEKLGFDFIENTNPDYYYIINNKRNNNILYRKDVLITEGYDPSKTEHQIMLGRKLYRIYDAGNKKYKLIIS